MKAFILTIFVLLLNIQLFSQRNPDSVKAISILQNRGEVILKFPRTSNLPLQKLTLLVSISKVDKDSVEAYLNYNQFQNFLKLKLTFRIIEIKTTKSSQKASGTIWGFSAYPSFPQYVSIMDSFANAFPSLCKIITIGESVKNRALLYARINTDTTLAKPSVMFSSTMHGDETGGYILMLHLIDYLLTNYNKDSLATKLVDSLDIWINPLANPDGTYYDSTNVWSATRFNANNVDLNRNYPDPVEGLHPDGLAYQPESQAVMNLENKYHFVLSANYHAGDEVVNYPWDCTYTLHVDSMWFKYVASEFADTSQYFGRKGYFTSVSPNGITDGAQWYTVYGGRQDYITNFHQGREVTIELDAITKITPEDSLLKLWDYNYRSFLHFLEQAFYGFHGFVYDSATQKPVLAKIELVGHDNDSSVVYSDAKNGSFYRPVYSGNYSLKVSATGYKSAIIQNISIQNNETKYFKFYLVPGVDQILINNLKIELFPNPCFNYFQILDTKLNGKIFVKIISMSGENVYSAFIQNGQKVNVQNLVNGIYFVEVLSNSTRYYCKIEVEH